MIPIPVRRTIQALAVIALAAPSAQGAVAAAGPGFPPGAVAREERLLARLPPASSACAIRQGRAHARAAFTEAEAMSAARTCAPDLGGRDVEALAFLALMAASKAAQEDLQAINAQVAAIDARKQSQRSAQPGRQGLSDAKDSLSDMSEMDSMRLQTAMDRRGKLYEALSNLMKRSADANAAITGNLK